MSEITAALWERQELIEADMANLGKDRYWKETDRANEKGQFGDSYVGSILTKLTLETYRDAISAWMA